MTVNRSIISGVGAYLPERIMTNDELSRLVDTTDEWITERSGIRARHIAADGETTSDLGTAAAKRALVRAGIDPVDIDLVVCATATPDRTFPATAVRIQKQLGIVKGAAFDIQAVCSGFVYALATADNFLRTGQSKRALVIGAETFSRILDWSDRSTCVLFGDGAGAVVLEARPADGTNDDRGILATRLRSDGRFED
ncbi:MAG: beta-ketoacyl-ACP synthase 3, partial [Pseudomonadota bacterium]